jgi:hypothetical protein
MFVWPTKLPATLKITDATSSRLETKRNFFVHAISLESLAKQEYYLWWGKVSQKK